MAEERCETCRFWRVDDGEGQCRRNPPSVNVAQAVAFVLNLRDLSRVTYTHSQEPEFPYDELRELDDDGKETDRRLTGASPFSYTSPGVWPETSEGDWCGEHSPLPGGPPG
jgi:hypothetical protein